MEISDEIDLNSIPMTQSNFFRKINVNKYWRNQNLEIKLHKNHKFTDDTFPPGIESLIGSENNKRLNRNQGVENSKKINTEEIEWMRISQIYKKFNLFDHEIKINDINQGELGNCYFMSAISSLTKAPSLIYRLFRTSEVNVFGYYEIVLFIDGEWQIVIVDDFFPVIKGTSNRLRFARPNEAEIWVMLLEKAWAKINMSYCNIIAGSPAEAMSCLSGFSSETTNILKNNYDSVWENLLLSQKNEFLVCVSTKTNVNYEKYGIISNHAYPVFYAKEYRKGNHSVKLLKLRNPWGYKEWKGNWSAKSNQWCDELKKYFGFNEKEVEGYFWMEFCDFIEFFNVIYVCHLMFDSYVKSFEVNDIDKIQSLSLHINEFSKFSISIIPPQRRFNHELSETEIPLTMLISRIDHKKFMNIEGSYTSHQNIEYAKDLNKGDYLIVFYSNFNSSLVREMKIRIRVWIHCTRDFKCRLVEHMDFSLIKRLLIEGIKENKKIDFEKDGIVNKIENQFKKTGLGYRYIKNSSENSYVLNNDWSGIENMKMIPETTEKSNKFIILPESEVILIALKDSQINSFWFNLISSLSPINESNKDLSVNEEIPTEFENIIFKCEELDSPEYDYKTPSLILNKTFAHIDINQLIYSDLFREYSKYLKLLEFLIPLNDSITLKWGKKTDPGGTYIGQFNPQNKYHGKGVFIEATGDYYIGLWKDNRRNYYGKLFNFNDSLIYEGEYIEDYYSGKGTLYFDNGDHYNGCFYRGKMNGKGVYFAKFKGKWEGFFLNGEFHGKGIFHPFKGKSFELKYSNGRIIK